MPVIQVYVNDKELKQILAGADKVKRSTSSFARLAILEKVLEVCK